MLIGGHFRDWIPDQNLFLVELNDSISLTLPSEYKQFTDIEKPKILLNFINTTDIDNSEKVDYIIYLIFPHAGLYLYLYSGLNNQHIIDYTYDQTRYDMFPYHGFSLQLSSFGNVERTLTPELYNLLRQQLNVYISEVRHLDDLHKIKNKNDVVSKVFNMYTLDKFPHINIIEQYNIGFVVQYSNIKQYLSDSEITINLVNTSDGKYAINFEYYCPRNGYIPEEELFYNNNDLILVSGIDSLTQTLINEINENNGIDGNISHMNSNIKLWCSEIINAYKDFTETIELPPIII